MKFFIFSPENVIITADDISGRYVQFFFYIANNGTKDINVDISQRHLLETVITKYDSTISNQIDFTVSITSQYYLRVY